jgi:hypothetical protein
MSIQSVLSPLLRSYNRKGRKGVLQQDSIDGRGAASASASPVASAPAGVGGERVWICYIWIGRRGKFDYAYAPGTG